MPMLATSRQMPAWTLGAASMLARLMPVVVAVSEDDTGTTERPSPKR